MVFIELGKMDSNITAAKIVCALLLLLCFGASNGQENAHGNISPSLYECYNGTVDRWNLLPHDVETLIAILRKIEDSPGAGNMDLRVFTTAILHRFRQDGIVRSEGVVQQPGILPYAPNGQQFYRGRMNLKLIPGTAVNFPNSSISALERCTLHSMLSSSTDLWERGDEPRTCKFDSYRSYYRRRRRSLDKSESLDDQVEIFTPEQRDLLQNMEDSSAEDPSALYPALPDKMRAQRQSLDTLKHSRCPVEQGVLKTRWGSISGGSIIAGIAAGLGQQSMRLAELMKNQDAFTRSQREAVVDNKFLGTLSGDLAEVSIRQGPNRPANSRFTVGAKGNWNSTVQPRYYFLGANEDLEMTEAEIRGDLDGLIMGSYIQNNSRTHEKMKLSQVLDMYYSERGLFEKQYRACNRRAQSNVVAPTEHLVKQTYAAAILLNKGITTATITNYDKYEEYARQAVKDFADHLPTMNQDSSCEVTRDSYADSKPIDEPAVDLKIVLDTSWPFHEIEPILYQLLKSLEVSKYGSNYTIINGRNGEVVVNSTHQITDYHLYFNSSVYERLPKGLELFPALESLRRMQTSQLNHEKQVGIGGGKSDVALLVPYTTSISEADKQLCWEALKVMREQVPDASVLFLTHGPKDRWRDLVLDPDSDIVSVSSRDLEQAYPEVDVMQERIRRVPRRMINSRCGAAYEKDEDRSAPITDSVGPNGINFYRIHPNYFHGGDTENPPTIKIQGTGSDNLRVCTSRELLHVNATDALMQADCTSITTKTHSFTMNCEGAYYIHECKPYYLAISANASVTGTFNCQDSKVCRYPNNIRYTISYENLICKSGASSLLAAPLTTTLLLLLLFALRG